MSKIIIFGNSASGKSTLAKKMSDINKCAHLDLDSIAWQHTSPPTRTPVYESKIQIEDFINHNECWVVEGCYADLINLMIDKADQVIFLNLPVNICITNAKNRPWEPHKYESKQAQDLNLEMLINWISEYPKRQDCCSQKAHIDLYTAFKGKKTMQTSNQ